MGLLWEVENMETKVCSKCGMAFPRTSEFFFKQKRGKDGLQGQCKKCRSKCNKEHYRRNKERYSETRKKYYINNKEWLLEYNKKWWKENFDRIAKWKVDYDKQYKINNYELVTERNREWRKNNPEKIREYARRQRVKNPEKARFYNKRRKARKKQLRNDFTKSQWDDTLKYFGHSCAYCGIKTESLEQEHFHPLSKGGEYSKANIIPACRDCNNNKREKLFHDWYPKQPFFNKRREQRILKYLGYKDKQQQIALF
jgi:hypothetical protein